MPCFLRHRGRPLFYVAVLAGLFSLAHSIEGRPRDTINTSAVMNSRDLFAARNLTQAESRSVVESFATSWGLREHAFAQLAGQSVNVEDIEASPEAYPAVLVVLPGRAPPVRPKAGAATPFLSVATQTPENEILQVLPLSHINKAAVAASSLLGFNLYPLSLEVVRLNSNSRGPWVLYDVSAGTVHLDARVINNMQQMPLDVGAYLAEYAVQLFSRLSADKDALQQATNTTALGGIISTAAAATGIVVTSQVPLWYCFTCPIVLGMLFPFVFNFGLGKVADELCSLYSLPTEQCNELWYSAFALAMVLSFASVLPIVSICRLAQCARPTSPAVATLA